MREKLKMLPNALSGLRLGLVPVLWVLAVQGRTGLVGLGLILAGATDILDGWLARRLNVTSAAGARLDSLADNLIAPSGAVWLVMLRPDVVQAHLALFLTWLALYALFIAFGLIKFRRFGNLHLYSSKAATVLLYAFIVHCFLLPGIPHGLFYLAVGLAIVGLLEGLAYQAISTTVSEDAGTLIHVLRRRREGLA